MFMECLVIVIDYVFILIFGLIDGFDIDEFDDEEEIICVDNEFVDDEDEFVVVNFGILQVVVDVLVKCGIEKFFFIQVRLFVYYVCFEFFILLEGN